MANYRDGEQEWLLGGRGEEEGESGFQRVAHDTFLKELFCVLIVMVAAQIHM